MKRLYFSKLIVLAALLTGYSIGAHAQTSTYNYVTTSLQTYTVPPTVGSISILAKGAKAGNNTNDGAIGGSGAIMQGNFTVVPGHVLNILVGQAGSNAQYVGGGGGGTYVWDVTAGNTLLIAAGGGGGAGHSDVTFTGINGVNATTTNLGTNGNTLSSGAGTAGNAATVPTGIFNYAGGGGGWLAGTGNAGTPEGCGPVCLGGSSALSGGAGGTGGGSSGPPNGGYGGGGGGNGRCGAVGGGGGGGYSGGGAGGEPGDGSYQSGGGGGSYNIGTAQVNSVGNTGNGQVVITVLCSPPGTVSGPGSLCAFTPGTFTISGTAAPGTWSSSSTAVATINPSTGVVSPLAAGTTTITYNIGSPCGPLATATLTVNAAPTPLSLVGGSLSMCAGSITSFSTSPAGGTWSSSNTAFATVDGGGNVTGAGLGNPTISYTLVGGCFAAQQVTVNLSPGPITVSGGGPVAVCKGSTVTLTNSVAGGTWSSNFTFVASVNSPITSGVVTGVNGGSATIDYTLSPSGCSATATITVNGLPTAYSVGFITGRGDYCIGQTTPGPIGLTNSATGVNYQLMLGVLPVGPLYAGTGSPLNFGVQTTSGTYTVIATSAANGCINTMNSSALVTANTLPQLFTVSGGGSFCDGGVGLPVSVSGCELGVRYQLKRGGVDVPGGVFFCAGSPFSYPSVLATLPGIYTVEATNGSTGCTNNMLGNATITVNPLPNPYNITPPGGSAYCEGGAGVKVGLDYSNTGISYQLYYGAVPQGDSVLGTGDSISFGYQAAVGSYFVVATNIVTRCSANMTGTTTINTVALPTPHNVTSSGTSYCAGDPGIDIGLDGSDFLINYQLYRGAAAVGPPVAGGSPIDFGMFTAPGTYTVVGTDATYGCVTNMTGSATVAINALPLVFNVTGGGGYCAVGGSGSHVFLSGSQSGVTYTLKVDGSTITTRGGTGALIDFGLLTTAGVYTVDALNDANPCGSHMSGAATIIINPPPPAYTLSGGGNYCSGGTGVDIMLDVSSTGVTYQLYNGVAPSGPSMAGTGSALDFGLRTAAGVYTIVGTNVSTTCTANMTGSVTIGINPLPGLHLVTGGGQLCAGATGVPVGINGSDLGIRYQLYNGSTAMGGPIDGDGHALDFGLQTLAGTYTIIATDTTTLCTRTMTGLVVVVVSPLPTAFVVTGGGIYCEGGLGVHIGLSGSNANVRYQLWRGAVLVTTFIGTGAPIDFGSQVALGSYTVIGINISTGCINPMAGTAVVVSAPLPLVYTVIGGGSYCNGADGIDVSLSGSNTSVNYQLYKNSAATGLPMPGTGGTLDFGLQSAGVYTVIATDALAGCTKNMAGSAVITVNSLPAVYNVLGGGSYCEGGTGYHIYLNTSAAGISYQLMRGTDAVGSPVTGTGAGIDLGYETEAGTYTATATNTGTGCASDMSGSATIILNPLPTMHAVTASDGGQYCITGTGVHVGLDGSESGIKYQLFRDGLFLGSPVTGTGSALDFGIRTAGNYSIVATNTATTCNNNMGSVTVTAVPLPVVYSVTGGGNYCETGLGVHVGLSGSETTVTYQLYHLGVAMGLPVTGTGTAIDFGLKTATGTYTVIAGNGVASCNSTMGSSAVVTMYPVIIPVVNVSSNRGDTVCVGQLVTYTATPINGGPSPAYQWLVNGMPYGTGDTYSYVPLDGDVVTAALTSNGICAIPDTATRSVRMTVSVPQMPAVHVAVSPGNVICQGSPAVFTAATSFGGSSPTITWLKNSMNVGSGLTYSYTPVNNDVIVVKMTSDFPCRLADDVFSNTNTMTVEPSVIPTVSISVNPGTNIAPGQNVTFTATTAHGGAHPVYQWLINKLVVHGANAATFTSNTLANGDSVTCEVVGGCALTGFNSVVVHVGSTGVQQITSAGSDDIRLVPNPNKGAFTVKGTMGSTASEEVSLEVTNMLGQVIYTGKVVTQNGAINEQIQLNSSLANGMYILNLRSGSQNNTFHFVIEQ